MVPYTVSTIQTPRFPIHPVEGNEPFEVLVQDEREKPVARLGAMSPDHARMIAGALVLLLPKLEPGRTVVLDASFNGSSAKHSAT